MNAAILPTDDDRRNVLAYTFERAQGDLRQRAEILTWPWSTRTSPQCWRDFCACWPLYMGLENTKRGVSPVEPAAVLHAIVDAMSPDGNHWATFVGYDRIAERAHVTRKTVQRVIADWQANSPMPLVSASSPGNQTKGIQHATRRLELIADPLTFAAARDASREAQRAAFRRQYAEQERDSVFELQRARVMAATDDPQTDEALRAGVTQAVDRARGRLPRRVALTQIAPSGTLVREDRRSTGTGPTVQGARTDGPRQGGPTVP